MPLACIVRGDKEASMVDRVVPQTQPQPKGKANILRQGQTMNDAYGQDPGATGTIPPVKDYPNLGSGA